MTTWNFSECNFGITKRGILYMLGRRSGPKVAEYLFAATSVLILFVTVLSCVGSRGYSAKLSQVVGSMGFEVLAQGQKPSRRPLQTEVMKAWFGWVVKYCSNKSMLIGQTITKSSE
jgi:hypothetical protein